MVRIYRILCPVACALLLSVAARAQVIPSVDREGKPPIEVKLSSTSMMLCIGSSIPLDLELINRGTDEIRIDKYDFWSHFNYGYLGDRATPRGGSVGSSCDSCRGDFIFLKPDKPYETSFNYSLNRDFFKDEGRYIIKVTIEGVPSNELNFELYNCN